MISESTPTHSRGRLVLSAFGFQAAGALAGTVIGYVILANYRELEAWRWMYATAIIPALLVLFGRFFIARVRIGSPYAAASTRPEKKFFAFWRARRPIRPKSSWLNPWPVRMNGISDLPATRLCSRKICRATILASVPWFLQDLGTYGIGIFTPTNLAAAVGRKDDTATSVATLIHNDLIAAKGTALIDLLLVVGIVGAVLLADGVSRIGLMTVGFIGCALGLAIAAQSVNYEGSANTLLIFVGFMVFNFMTNLGPNSQTYLLAGEVFPTAIRQGEGRGLRRIVRQNRRLRDGFPVSHPAGRSWHRHASQHTRRHVAAWRARHMAIRDRDGGHPSGCRWVRR